MLWRLRSTRHPHLKQVARRVGRAMTLKIDRQSSEGRVVVRLIGNLDAEHLAEVRAQVCVAGFRVVMDVAELALVSVEGVRLLNACEDDGVAVVNASPYISKWMALERDTGRNQT